MSATLPDVVLTNTTYKDLYTKTGITVGLPLVIQNKSSTVALVKNNIPTKQ